MGLGFAQQETAFDAEMLMNFLRADKFSVDAKPVPEQLKNEGLDVYMEKKLADGSRLDFQLPPKEKRAGFALDRKKQQVTDKNGKTYDMEILARMWHVDADGRTGREYLFLENGAVMMTDVASPKSDPDYPVTRWQKQMNWRVLATKPGSVFLGEPLSTFEKNNRPTDKQGILMPDYNKDNANGIKQLMGFAKEFGMEG